MKPPHRVAVQDRSRLHELSLPSGWRESGSRNCIPTQKLSGRVSVVPSGLVTTTSQSLTSSPGAISFGSLKPRRDHLTVWGDMSFLTVNMVLPSLRELGLRPGLEVLTGDIHLHGVPRRDPLGVDLHDAWGRRRRRRSHRSGVLGPHAGARRRSWLWHLDRETGWQDIGPSHRLGAVLVPQVRKNIRHAHIAVLVSRNFITRQFSKPSDGCILPGGQYPFYRAPGTYLCSQGGPWVRHPLARAGRCTRLSLLRPWCPISGIIRIDSLDLRVVWRRQGLRRGPLDLGGEFGGVRQVLRQFLQRVAGPVRVEGMRRIVRVGTRLTQGTIHQLLEPHDGRQQRDHTILAPVLDQGATLFGRELVHPFQQLGQAECATLRPSR